MVDYLRINPTDSKKGTLKVDGIVANTNNEIIGHKIHLQIIVAQLPNSELYTNARAIYFDIIDTTETSTIDIDNVKSVVARGPVIQGFQVEILFCLIMIWTVTGDYSGGDSWARAAVGVGYGANVTIKSGKLYSWFW